jgi:hypothetical protein
MCIKRLGKKFWNLIVAQIINLIIAPKGTLETLFGPLGQNGWGNKQTIRFKVKWSTRMRDDLHSPSWQVAQNIIKRGSVANLLNLRVP